MDIQDIKEIIKIVLEKSNISVGCYGSRRGINFKKEKLLLVILLI